MNICGEGTLNRCEICDIDFKNKKVKYSVDAEEHYLDLDFDEKIVNYESEKEMTDVISLSMEDGSNYTFYQCSIKEVSSDKCKIFFQTSLQGDYIGDINDTLCMSVDFIINASPIPLSAVSFLPQYSNIECANVSVKCKNNINGVLITLESKNNMLSLDIFETIFFNILDITFLGNGYYPYIISEFIHFNNKKYEINHLHQSIYIKGKSDSHWTKSIISGRDLNLNKIYPIYLKNIEKNELIIPVLRNVFHNHDIYSNLILSNLIQCVEGYMKKLHLESKYSKNIVKGIKSEIKELLSTHKLPEDAGVTMQEITDSILGLIGMINQPNFNECLSRAIDYNEYTKEVFWKEIESNLLDDFIKKSKKTRNQFSHMIPLKDTITEGIELYQAINKYSLLLRILILSDLNVKIYKSSIKRYISDVNSSTCQ